MSGLTRGRKASLAALGLVVIGSIGPWVTLAGTSASGLDKDGALTLVIALIGAAYLVFVTRPHWSVPAMVGFLTGFVAIFDIVDISDTSAIFGIAPSPGWGIWLTAVASIGLLVAAVAIVRREEPGTSLRLVEKILLGLGAALIVLFVIGLAAGDDEVAGIDSPPELTPVAPPEQP